MKTGPRFRDIPQLTDCGHYCVNISWDYLEDHIRNEQDRKNGVMGTLDLEPDFQRGYVWTMAQKVAYVEYILRGGRSGRDIYFNCVGWNRGWEGPFVIVDGKQRLEAVRGFLADKVLAFGNRKSEYTDKLRMVGPDFLWHVNDLDSRAKVLQWYLEMNAGGTVHTQDELDRVRDLLAKE